MRVSTLSRVVLFLSLGLLLSLPGCKDKLEDLPDIDPIDDQWIDNIDTGEDLTAEVPADPAVPTTEVAHAPVAGEQGDVAVAAVDPNTDPVPDPATAAKLAGATVPASKPKSGGVAEPDSPAVDPSAPVDPAPAAEPAPADPTPAVEPTPEPEPAKPAAPPPITMADFGGSFRFSGGSSQRQDLADAIDFGANQVSAIIRGIARKRLTKTQIIEDPVTLTITGDDAKFHWGTTGEGMTCVIDGPTTTMSYGGDKYKARCRQKDGKLITSFQAPDATKTIVYVLSSDRKTMTAHHKLVADQLSEPVTFKVTYTRK